MLRQDMELGGVRLKRGDQIVAMLVAANLDPAANMHPEKLLLVLLVLILGALLVIVDDPHVHHDALEFRREAD